MIAGTPHECVCQSRYPQVNGAVYAALFCVFTPIHRGRSGGVADAVRGRSFDPRPAGEGRALGVAVAGRLTPARGSARKLDVNSRRAIGSGGAVPAEPAWNRTRNWQSIEIATIFSRFQRFQPVVSRHVRAPVCARSRAHIRVRDAGTVEPYKHIYVLQIDIGSRGGSRAVPSGSRDGERGTGPADLGDGNILAGRYDRRVVQLGWRGHFHAPLRENFGRFRLGGAVAGGGDGLDRGGARPLVGNGGFLRVSGCRSERVGRLRLEGCAQGVGVAAFSGLRHQPSRLRRRIAQARQGGLDRAGHPPMPPFRAAISPRGLAREAGRNLDRRFRSDLIDHGIKCGVAGNRQGLSGTIGSGLGVEQRRVAELATGRGAMLSGSDREKLRRSAQARAGGCDVN